MREALFDHGSGWRQIAGGATSRSVSSRQALDYGFLLFFVVGLALLLLPFVFEFTAVVVVVLLLFAFEFTCVVVIALLLFAFEFGCVVVWVLTDSTNPPARVSTHIIWNSG